MERKAAPDTPLPPAIQEGGAAGEADSGSVPAEANPKWTVTGPLAVISRYGVLIALVLLVGVFAAIRPEVFLTADNTRSILTLAAPTLVLALGLTVVLTMNDFDLSVGAMVGLGGAFAVVLMTGAHLVWPLAVVGGLAIGLLIGLGNGLLVTVTGASSFIVTLGMTSVITGIEFLLTKQRVIFSGLAPEYVRIGQGTFLTVNYQVWIALVLSVVVYVFLHRTEAGRYMYAIGNSPGTARLAGIRINRMRTVGFMAAALGAAIAGILLTAQGASSTPQAGISYLLPAYAAAFLGSAVFKPGRFNVPGTVVGVLFLGVIQTGLDMLGLSTAVVNIVEGAVLVLAIALSRLDRNLSWG